MKNAFKRKLAAIIGLWILIGVGYSNSLTVSWHLDDYPNIVNNEKIQITQFDYDSVVDTFFAGNSGKLYRPVSMVSFALNWYYSANRVFGYHVVNLLIHCINSFFLYLIVLSLLQEPRFYGLYSSSKKHWIAFIATVFWALSPVQTQAVTYVVQRMTSLAALFYIIGIYLYLRYKNAVSNRSRTVLLAGIGVSYLLAVLSKENAILFPFSIYLIETIFYAYSEHRNLKRRFWTAPVALTLFALIAGFAFVLIELGNPFLFFERIYSERPFTAIQRLLTEPRILLLYLSLLFVPVPSRLSLGHDITVSTSFFEPWTTLPAILIVLAIIILCIVNYKKRPLITFAFLFFFLNHGVESTILPLELAFEHRNYLPSLFLFVPLAHYMVKMSCHLFLSNKYGYYLVVTMVCIPVAILCNWTFDRNFVWHSERSLWEDEISKNTKLARPYHNLAWGYYQPLGKYEEALALYRKALTLKVASSIETASTLNNMGRIYYLMGDYDHALRFFEKSIKEHRGLKIVEYQIAMTLIQLCSWQEALEKIDATLQINEFHPAYLRMKGIVLSKLGDDDQAIAFFYRSLEQKPGAVDTRAHLSIVLSRIGHYDESDRLLAGIGVNETRKPLFMITRSEIEKQKGDVKKSDEYFNQFILDHGIEKSREILLSLKKDKLSVSIDYDYYLTKIKQLDVE